MPEEVLTLDSLQQQLLLPELDTFLAAAPDVAGREAYLALRAAVNAGTVPLALAGRLELVTELLLTSGKARRTHGPAAERSLWSLFQKTPRGQTLQGALAALNRAVRQLEGRTIEAISVVARAPGAYSLTLKSAELQLILRFDATGAQLESVEVGTA